MQILLLPEHQSLKTEAVSMKIAPDMVDFGDIFRALGGAEIEPVEGAAIGDESRESDGEIDETSFDQGAAHISDLGNETPLTNNATGDETFAREASKAASAVVPIVAETKEVDKNSDIVLKYESTDAGAIETNQNARFPMAISAPMNEGSAAHIQTPLAASSSIPGRVVEAILPRNTGREEKGFSQQQAKKQVHEHVLNGFWKVGQNEVDALPSAKPAAVSNLELRDHQILDQPAKPGKTNQVDGAIPSFVSHAMTGKNEDVETPQHPSHVNTSARADAVSFVPGLSDSSRVGAGSSKPSSDPTKSPNLASSRPLPDITDLVLPMDKSDNAQLMNLSNRIDAEAVRLPTVEMHAPRNLTNIPVATVASQQIAVALSQSATGATELVLSPEELGRVRLNLTSLDGALTVVVQAERPETQDLLRRHIDILAQEMRDIGFRDVGFSFHQGDQSERSGSSEQKGEAELVEDQLEDSRQVLVLGGLDLRL